MTWWWVGLFIRFLKFLHYFRFAF